MPDIEDNDTDYRNPYYSPSSFGLEKIWSIDTGGSYEFDIYCIWYHEVNDQFYYGTDSGCSCPTPFENIIGLADLSRYSPNDIDQLETTIEKLVGLSYTDKYQATQAIRAAMENRHEKLLYE